MQSLATQLAKNLKTEKDLSNLSRELVKLTVETALGKEMVHANKKLETSYPAMNLFLIEYEDRFSEI